MQATNANFKNAIWAEDGVIMAIENFSPAYQIQQKKTDLGEDWDFAIDKAPPLGHWSDVTYINWNVATTAAQRKNLRSS